MNKADIDKYNQLADAVALYEYYGDYIKEAKKEIRNLTDEEVKEIKLHTRLQITRGVQTNYTYNDEYDEKMKKLKQECLVNVEKIDNYVITLTTASASTRKANEVINLAKNNITTLRKLRKKV